MSGPTVANHGLGVATTTSAHDAVAGPPDVCLDPPKKTPAPFPNVAPTDRATEHTTPKTKFQEGPVVRVGDAIGPPTDPAHPNTGGGVVSGTYREEARADKGSPEIRTEGKPPTRTTDTTSQNHGNTTGALVAAPSPADLAAAAAEALKTCSYKESTIKCSHQAVTKKAKIKVKRGDTVTIDAKRINAKVAGAAPACHAPPHMKWHIVRTGGLDNLGAALPPKTGDLTGDKLVLGSDWTGPGAAQLSVTGGMTDTWNQQALGNAANQAETFAQSNARVRGADRPNSADYSQAITDTNKRAEDWKAQDAKIAGAQKAAHLVLNVARFANEWRADRNPVRIQVTGAACSGGCSYEILGYPPNKFEFKYELEAFKSGAKTLSRYMGPIKTIGKLGGIEVDNQVVCPGGDFEFSVTFEWEEVDYDIARKATFEMKGLLFKWDFDIGVPIANLLQLIPIPGAAVLARALNWLIKLVGEAKFGFHITIGVSFSAGFSCQWSESKGWEWSVNLLSFPIEFNVYFYVRFHIELLGQLGHLEGRGGIKAEPTIQLEMDASGSHLGNGDFKFSCYGTVNVVVNTWLYKVNEALEFKPAGWDISVPKTRWLTSVKN